MIYFLLPNVHISICQYIECIVNSKNPEPKISNSLSHYLSDIKDKINYYEHDWDSYKKYTNPYEYINSILPNKQRCVSKYKPLSRSYFKMIEILSTFSIFVPEQKNIFDKTYTKPTTGIKSFHLAEGPGGFIEALANMRNNPSDSYIGMTILDDENDLSIPAWKKSDHFLKNNPNVFIENASDGTGNILSIENFDYCIDKYGSSMDIVTADGGFDFSVDFNNQEVNITKLLYGQICYSLCLQKRNGYFILKLFDCFMEHSVDLLYILSAFYEKVYITKPQTSRYANSEKYIVCKNFLFSSNQDIYKHLRGVFINVINTQIPIHRLLNIPIPNYFLNKLEEYNAIFGQQQIENIHQTIILIENKHKNDKIEAMIKTNIQKCIQWCIKYNVPYNLFTNGLEMKQPEAINDSQKKLSISPPPGFGYI